MPALDYEPRQPKPKMFWWVIISTLLGLGLLLTISAANRLYYKKRYTPAGIIQVRPPQNTANSQYHVEIRGEMTDVAKKALEKMLMDCATQPVTVTFPTTQPAPRQINQKGSLYPQTQSDSLDSQKPK